jgi:hypothetical protein
MHSELMAVRMVRSPVVASVITMHCPVAPCATICESEVCTPERSKDFRNKFPHESGPMTPS